MWPSNILIYKMFGTAKVDTYTIEAYFWKVSLNKVCDKFDETSFFQGPYPLALWNGIYGQSVWDKKG